MSKKQKKSNNPLTKFLRNFFILIVLIISSGFAVILILWMWWAHSINTITLKDLSIKSCDELPNFSEIDSWFISNKDVLSIFLDDLSKCKNNIFVCDRFSKCNKESYSKHKISSGNTIIEWKKVPECSEKKGAILISHTSACEIKKINYFLNENPEFNKFPIDYYNY